MEKIINSLRDAVQRNEPESAIDRLHTLVLAFARERCDTHGVLHNKGEPLHSVFGKYVNRLNEKGLVESKMARTILKESVKLFDTFNDVRNNFSAAHATQLLTQAEGYLILGWVRGTLDFVLSVDSVEEKINQAGSTIDWDDLPF
ncbi:MAG: abortive infection family protein [bacterium]|nr:abortive infection family protein [bacterium]